MQELVTSNDPLLIFLLMIFVSILAILFLWSSKQNHQDQSSEKKSKNEFQKRYRNRSHEKSIQKEQIQSFHWAKVEHVIDGDTVIVSKTWHKFKIRLDSIDCPEDGQHWGDIATYGLIKLIGGRKIQYEDHGLDHYGRTLATIYVQQDSGSGWTNVNERMITLGHAWVMRRFYNHLPKNRQDKLNQLERWARTKKVGLWKSTNPIPPWKWRNQS